MSIICITGVDMLWGNINLFKIRIHFIENVLFSLPHKIKYMEEHKISQSMHIILLFTTLSHSLKESFRPIHQVRHNETIGIEVYRKITDL